jgi:hypothetical protein
MHCRSEGTNNTMMILCKSALVMLQFMLISVDKNEIDFSRNDLFFRYGLSGWSFGSCQNTKCLVLDLSVLF